MPEGEISQERIPVTETPERSFADKIQTLTEPTDEAPQGLITNLKLRNLASLASLPHNQANPALLEGLLKNGNDLCAQKKVDIGEWSLLAGVIHEQFARLQAAAPAIQETRTSPQEIRIDLQPLVRQQQALLQAVEGQRMSLDQFLALSQEQTQELVDSLSRISPERERERWVDVEYAQEFYTRFTPTMEPRFYTEVSSAERELYDARWQLARAAYFKKAYSAFPEKQTENQDLQLLRTEQMEKLYQMPGVRSALEWYADTIVSGRRIRLPDGRKMTIWECESETDFEQLREAMRQQALSSFRDLAAKEADAVAWNWIWCSNLIESVDSRYSFRGRERHGSLPGVLTSDDIRSTFHPQEKYEDKCRSGLEWGAFGKWGVTQMEKIKGKVNFDNLKDEIKFKAATSPNQFWMATITNRTSSKGGRVIEVYAPECYPTKSVGSFWEETRIGEKPLERTLLDFLLKKDEIPWREVGSDTWIGYLPIKFNKAVGLFEYFNPGKTMELGKENVWVNPLVDIIRRLGLENALGEKAFHNLKVWAVYAALGGVGQPHVKLVTTPLSTFSRTALESKLRAHQLGLLEQGGIGTFSGETLVIK